MYTIVSFYFLILILLSKAFKINQTKLNDASFVQSLLPIQWPGMASESASLTCIKDASQQSPHNSCQQNGGDTRQREKNKSCVFLSPWLPRSLFLLCFSNLISPRSYPLSLTRHCHLTHKPIVSADARAHTATYHQETSNWAWSIDGSGPGCVFVCACVPGSWMQRRNGNVTFFSVFTQTFFLRCATH